MDETETIYLLKKFNMKRQVFMVGFERVVMDIVWHDVLYQGHYYTLNIVSFLYKEKNPVFLKRLNMYMKH